MTPPRLPVVVELPQLSRDHAVTYNVTVVFVGSLLLAVCAQVAIPLPFTPVPVTGQTFGVLLLAFLVGGKRATAATLLYLAEGASGLPVFAKGAGGAQHLFGPTGGYLLAFLPAAWVTGAFAERGWDRSYRWSLAAMAIGTLVILLGGALRLAILLGSWDTALQAGVYPFLLGAVIKMVLAAAILPTAWKWLGHPSRDNEAEAMRPGRGGDAD